MQDDASQKYVAAKHYFGGNAQFYDQRRSRKGKWKEENWLVESYVSQLPRDASVLDVPFGTGRFAPAYLKAGLRITGVDISSDMIEEARRRFGAEIQAFDLRVAAAEKLPFADRTFDYLICNRFIKWLPEESLVATVAAEFRRVCRREMLIQVKVGGSSGETAVTAIRRSIARIFRRDDSGRQTARYSMSQLESFFATGGWVLARVIDAPKVGHGVKYLVLRNNNVPA